MDCYNYVPEEVHVVETITWLVLSTMMLLALEFPQVLKECVRESRKEARRVSVTYLGELLLFGFCAIFMVIRIRTSNSSLPLALLLLQANYSSFIAMLLCCITMKRSAAGHVMGLLCVSYAMKGIMVSILDGSEEKGMDGGFVFVAIEILLMLCGCMYLLCGRNFWGLRMLQDIPNVKWLMCWVALQMNCLLEVVTIASKVNVDFMLCPTSRVQKLILDHMYPVQSSVHSFRSVFLFVVLVLTFIFIRSISVIGGLIRSRVLDDFEAGKRRR